MLRRASQLRTLPLPLSARGLRARSWGAVTRSPVYVLFSQCLDGLFTIRAYRASGHMLARTSDLIDANARWDLAEQAASRWLSMRLAAIGGLITLACALGGVLLRDSAGPDSAAAVGLMLSYALNLSFGLIMVTRLSSQTENSFNAVERVLHYGATVRAHAGAGERARLAFPRPGHFVAGPPGSRLCLERSGAATQQRHAAFPMVCTAPPSLARQAHAARQTHARLPLRALSRHPSAAARQPPENGGLDRGPEPPPNWPSAGRVDFVNVCVRYRPDLPDVLTDLSFSVGAASKVGIVGRTGAGKSSLVSALFRLVQPYRGTILIDGVDATAMRLSSLRAQIGIIPQEPVSA